MKRNYLWGTVNELILLGILACINVSYINATDIDPSKWVITDVYDESTLVRPNDPIFGNKSLVVLFHSINFLAFLLTTTMLYTSFNDTYIFTFSFQNYCVI